jgi:hypothetical protein
VSEAPLKRAEQKGDLQESITASFHKQTGFQLQLPWCQDQASQVPYN